MKKNLPQPMFNEAVADYQYLLGRKYPKKAIQKMIGDRYLLCGVETLKLSGSKVRILATLKKNKLTKE